MPLRTRVVHIMTLIGAFRTNFSKRSQMILNNTRQQLLIEAKTFLRRAVLIAGNLRRLSKLTNISYSTLSRIAGGKHKGTRATRLKLEAFIEQNETN